ncbi:MAG TPA: hypothetical protein VK177_07105 [Flavobacteriales bacterium]|nr:hypothetical protein [Flavobacteriales bacterium]
MKRFFLFSLFLFIGFKASTQVAIDTFLTDYGRFLAAKPCLSKSFADMQKKAYYKDHVTFTQKMWKHINDSTIAKINAFIETKNLRDAADTVTCFYPFGGPDFLFANVFYPNAKNYVLMGLENLGSVADITKKKDADCDLLLAHLNESMQYLNKSGYFVTSHMSKDFSKSLMNGTIHTVLYFAANRNYMVKKLENGSIDSKGNFASGKSGYYKAWDLTLTDSTGNEKHVYYISANIVDFKVSKTPYFTTFVKNMGKHNTFIKSASYIPPHKNFSIVRNLILESQKIIQDDTGIQHKMLNDATKWTYEYWGTYTMTIKDLSWGFQQDLKDAVAKSPNNKKLPFRISYNGNYGEGLIMVARKKQ